MAQSQSLCWTLSTSVGMDRHLHEVIADGDLPQVLHLLDNGASVNCYVDGLTPMARAISCDEPHIAESLLKFKPDVHQGRRQFAMMRSRSFGSSASRGHDVQHEPLLILAVLHAYPDLVKSLIDLGADVNATDQFNRCALHIAVEEDQPEILHMLLDNGSNVNRVDVDSNSALHLAVQNGHQDMAKTLVDADAMVNLPGHWDALPLHIACRNGNFQMVKFLLESGSMISCKDADLETPLHYAAKGGHVEIVKELLSHHASSHDVDETFRTPLHRACEGGHAGVVHALIKHGGADPNQEAGSTTTYLRRLPIQLAALGGHMEVVSTLLELGANVNLQDSVHEENALNWAIRCQHTDIVDLLLRNGVDAHVVNTPDGSSSIHVACLFDADGRCCDIMKKLLQNGVDVNLPDKHRMETALHIAARRGCWKLLEVLLGTPQIKVNQVDESKLTPLRMAIYYEQTRSAVLLIKHGANFNHHPANKPPCLHAAISRSLYEVAIVLVQHGADVCMVDRHDGTPLAALCRDAAMAVRLAKGEETDQAFELLSILLAAGAKVDESGQGTIVTRTLLSTDKVLLDLVLSNSMGSPTTLQRLAICCVRKRLINVGDGSSIWPLVDKLPVPKALKAQLCLKLPL